MINLFYTICDAFCALSMGQQMLIGLACVLIAAGIVWLILWGLCALLYKLAESVGVSLDADYEPYDADWMDFDAWGRGHLRDLEHEHGGQPTKIAVSYDAFKAINSAQMVEISNVLWKAKEET